MLKRETATEIGEISNGGADAIEQGIPYVANLRLRGVADMLFHRWNCEAVEAKGKAAKGSKEKKSDNLESYVYRNSDGILFLPGEYVRQSIIHAANFGKTRSPSMAWTFSKWPYEPNRIGSTGNEKRVGLRTQMPGDDPEERHHTNTTGV